jgi:hypothetical protein
VSLTYYDNIKPAFSHRLLETTAGFFWQTEKMTGGAPHAPPPSGAKERNK